ncbi:C40 family peptidase [Aneurinibacillus sp. BA2021]|nr:C40 family peptidase [Aneurinibacillus sp. BA2021]
MVKKTIMTVAMAGAVAISSLFAPLGTETASASSESLVSKAISVLGTPYKWGGTSKSGFDCSGFLNYVYKSEKISLPRTANAMYQRGQAVSRSQLRTGDLVFFKTSSRAAVTHAGMYLSGGRFIHSSSSQGVSISSINDKYYWGSRYVGAKRITK